MLKKIVSKIYGVPFVINGYWPYYHADFKSKMDEKGLEIGGFPCNVSQGARFSFLWNKKHEFIYEVTGVIRLRGSDFFEGTDKEYNLKFRSRIKLRK